MPLKKVWDNLAGNWDLHPHDFIAAACRSHMLGESPPNLLTP
jgi:hypothetical protein